MLLTIDIGNTDIVFAVYKANDMLESWRCKTVATCSGDEYASFLNELFSITGIAFEDIKDVIISSVVPEADFHINSFCKKYLNCTAIMVSHEIVDISIDINSPEELGSDRIVNAVAVLEHYQAPAIVIDFGTATTFDVIDENGSYSGGVIAPGVNLSVSALHRAAAKLPSVSIKKPESVIGRDTVGAIQSGIYWGYVGLIKEIVEKISNEMGQTPFVIATGGLACLFADNISVIKTVDNDLALKGLLKIYQDYKG